MVSAATARQQQPAAESPPPSDPGGPHDPTPGAGVLPLPVAPRPGPPAYRPGYQVYHARLYREAVTDERGREVPAPGGGPVYEEVVGGAVGRHDRFESITDAVRAARLDAADPDRLGLRGANVVLVVDGRGQERYRQFVRAA